MSQDIQQGRPERKCHHGAEILIYHHHHHQDHDGIIKLLKNTNESAISSYDHQMIIFSDYKVLDSILSCWLALFDTNVYIDWAQTKTNQNLIVSVITVSISVQEMVDYKI